MAYNELIAQQIREVIFPFSDFMEEKKMFGGIAFMYKNKMSVGVVKDELMVRVVSEKYEEVLNEPNVSEMNFTGKTMKDFIYVSEEGFQTNEQMVSRQYRILAGVNGQILGSVAAMGT